MTAIQELIEKYRLFPGFIQTITNDLYMQLEKEKAQIIAAYCEGCKDTYGNDEPDPKKPDSYYGQLYYDTNYDKNRFKKSS